jgi:hypothetical protein
MENFTLREVKTKACAGRDVVARSKFLAPPPPRLRCDDLLAQLEFLGLPLTSFQKRSSDHLDFGLKQLS